MRKLVSLWFLLLCVAWTIAQTPMPDANLRAVLDQQFPGCILGNNIDGTHPGVVAATYLDISGANVSDLTGIQVFVNVQQFYASANPLDDVEAVPPNATYVQFISCQLTSVALPLGVVFASIWDNQLTSLDLSALTQLVDLNCRHNQLTSITGLPNSLHWIDCSYNQLTSLQLPYSIHQADVSHNLLTTVPPSFGLSNGGNLYAGHNQITSFPHGNYGLIDLSSNMIDSVGDLLGRDNNYIKLNNNPLTKGITELPVGLLELEVDSTQMPCLPYLNKNLQLLKCAGNSFSCIPNQPNNLTMSAADFGFPPMVCVSTDPCHVPLPTVDLKVLLQGPYNDQTQLMNDDLRAQSLIPTSEPYSALGLNYTGATGPDVFDPTVLSVTGPDAIVDWVVVDMYPDGGTLNPGNAVHYSRPALVQRDGDVVNLDGTFPVILNMNHGKYRTAIRHRNHLGALTRFGEWYGSDVTPVIDFTDWAATACYGYAMHGDSVFDPNRQLWSGDVTFDHQLKYTGSENDRDPILIEVGGSTPTAITTGYRQEDVNMDGVVKYTGAENDRDPILINIGGGVPTAVRDQVGF